MKNKVIAIGHINPDSDSILSAVLISRFGEKLFGLNVEAVGAGNANNETKYILEKLAIKKPRILREIKNEKVILVDTTEPKQIIGGITEDNLMAVIDHHNLGGLKSSRPIYSRVEPIGCTGSVIYKMLKERNVKIDKTSSVIIITCILSDTLNFNSPTATDDDRKILKELNKIAKLDIKKIVGEIFYAKSSLKGISVEDIIGKDYKQFDMGTSKVGIGVWETTNPESVNVKAEEIMKALAVKKTEQNLDYMYFSVVDILKNNSQLYLLGDKERSLAESVFKGPLDKNSMFLSGIVSRKKQIVPPLMEKLGK